MPCLGPEKIWKKSPQSLHRLRHIIWHIIQKTSPSCLQHPDWRDKWFLRDCHRLEGQDVEKPLCADPKGLRRLARFFSEIQKLSEAYIQLLHQCEVNVAQELVGGDGIPCARSSMSFSLLFKGALKEACLQDRSVPLLQWLDRSYTCNGIQPANGSSGLPQPSKFQKRCSHFQHILGIQSQGHERTIAPHWQSPASPLHGLQGPDMTENTFPTTPNMENLQHVPTHFSGLVLSQFEQRVAPGSTVHLVGEENHIAKGFSTVRGDVRKLLKQLAHNRRQLSKAVEDGPRDQKLSKIKHGDQWYVSTCQMSETPTSLQHPTGNYSYYFFY